MGNLGWNIPAATLISRSKNALHLAGIEEANVIETVAQFDPGSAVTVLFKDPDIGQRAKLSLDRIKFSPNNDAKTVFIVPKRTDEENRPFKMLHRLMIQVNNFEQTLDGAAEVKKVINGKYLTVGPNRCCWLFSSSATGDHTIKWSIWATQRFSEEQRDFCSAFATNF